MKIIKINGTKIEINEKDLDKSLRDFVEPKYEITLKGYYLYINDERIAASGYESEHCNYSSISRSVARAMGDLMETEDVLEYGDGYCIHYDTVHKYGYGCSNSRIPNQKHFKTKEKAELAAKLLNEYNRDNPIFGHKIGKEKEG